MHRIVMVPLVLAAMLAGACASTSSKPEEPMKLAGIESTLRVQRLWQSSVGGAEPKWRLGLGAAVDESRVYQASAHGVVQALEITNGKRAWSRDLKVELSAGPGAGESLVLVASTEGELIALASSDGAERWRASLGAEVLAAPIVSASVVVVRTADGALHGLAADTGARRWSAEQQVPSLTLRGTSAPLAVDGVVYAGFDNGRLIAVSLTSGAVQWEAQVSQPRGSTDLSRMVDLDSPLIAVGGDLYVAGYQGKVARISRSGGQLLWTRDLSSYRGLAADGEAVYVASAEGEVVKLDRRSGVEQWRQKNLLRRELSTPALIDGHVAVADLEGVVHWLDAGTGNFVARSKISGRVTAPPQVAGGVLLLSSDAGALEALKPAPSPKS